MLTGKQRRHLRALGHHLEPVVLVGKEGISQALVESAKVALETHELVKVRISENAGGRHELADELAKACGAELAGVLGRTALVYKRRKKDPKIKLPKE
jgi:RNA-binding protein